MWFMSTDKTFTKFDIKFQCYRSLHLSKKQENEYYRAAKMR